jgi:S-adenosylmethionine:tRNA-ribosyltransferase-isomerase (queuine synthetase)
MDLADFDYALPSQLIAQEPTPERDGARLLVLERGQDGIRHAGVRDLPELLRPGDLLAVAATGVDEGSAACRAHTGTIGNSAVMTAIRAAKPTIFAGAFRGTWKLVWRGVQRTAQLR